MPIRRFGNLGLVFYAFKRKLVFYASKRKNRARALSLDDGCVLNIKCPIRFSFTDLKRVTNNFSESNVIGGASGKVYYQTIQYTFDIQS